MTKYIDKEIHLKVHVPETFSGSDEILLETAIADLLTEEGYSLEEFVSMDPVQDTDEKTPKYIFDDELIVIDEHLNIVNGYLWATDDLVSQLKDTIRKDFSADEINTLDNINFYANLNLSTGAVELNSTFYFIDDSSGREEHIEVTLPVAEEDRILLTDLMDDYCHSREHMSTLDFLNEARSHEGLPLLDPIKFNHPPVSMTEDERKELLERIDEAMSRMMPNEVQDKIRIYESNNEDKEAMRKEIRFWSDIYGEPNDPDGNPIEPYELPLPLQRAYTELLSDDYGSYCLLVETPAGYGIGFLNDYDAYTAECYDLTHRELFQGVIREAQRLSQMPELKDAIWIAANEHNYDKAEGFSQHELFFVFPVDMDKEALHKEALKLCMEVYIGVEEISNEKKNASRSLQNLVSNAEVRASREMSENISRETERSI